MKDQLEALGFALGLVVIGFITLYVTFSAYEKITGHPYEGFLPGIRENKKEIELLKTKIKDLEDGKRKF